MTACGGGPLPRPSFSVTAEPERPFSAYGEILPVRFTVRNDTGTPVILEKVEGLTGRRRELATFREVVTVSESGIQVATPSASGRKFVRFNAVVPAGGTLSFTASVRCLTPGEDLLFLASPFRPGDLADSAFVEDGGGGLAPLVGDAAVPSRLYFPLGSIPGDSGMARAEARYDAPPPPFDPPVSNQAAWSFSPVLGGFVLRLAGGGMQILRADGPGPLPALPFDFLDDVEGKGAAKVMLESGDVTTITAETMSAFLADLVHRRRKLGFSDDPDKAPYQVDE